MPRLKRKTAQAAARLVEPAATCAPAPDSFEGLMHKFLDWMKVRNYSEETLSTRRHQLLKLFVWLRERSVLMPQEVTRAILEGYQKHLYYGTQTRSGRALSVQAQQSLLSGVKGYFRHLAKYHYLAGNPASEIEMPRQERRLPKFVPTVRELERIIESVNDSTVLGLRDRAILETLYSTGMRRGELCGLTLYSIDAERGTVLVHGKGKKDRWIPIGTRAVAWIERYVKESRPKLVGSMDEKDLFLTADGKALTKGRLSKLVRSYMVTSGLNKPGSCHLFRHAMATYLLENGADIRYIQEMLGHERLSTTQLYTRVSIMRLKAVHTMANPAEIALREGEEGVASLVEEARAADVAEAKEAETADAPEAPEAPKAAPSSDTLPSPAGRKRAGKERKWQPVPLWLRRGTPGAAAAGAAGSATTGSI